MALAIPFIWQNQFKNFAFAVKVFVVLKCCSKSCESCLKNWFGSPKVLKDP